MRNNVYNKIRYRVFRKNYPIDNELKNIVSGYKDYDFLVNNCGQYVFIYLAEFVKVFCESILRKPFSSIRILDWGCGKGHVSYLLKKSEGNVISCDRFDNSGDSSFGQQTPILEYAGINVIPLNHDYLLPFNDNLFDVVLSFGVLEHVPNDIESLKEINRILVKGGLFFCFNLPNHLSWTQYISRLRGDNYHDRLYRFKNIKSLLNKTNFDLIDIWYRQLFPKNSIDSGLYFQLEQIDNFLTKNTFLKYFSTNIEFIGLKK